MEKLHVGIIGLGFGGQVHLPGFTSIAQTKVIAISDTDLEKGQKIAKAAKVQFFPHWRDLVASPKIDIVSVATPPTFQAEIVCDALSAGKHVLCEKPFGMNLPQAKTMLAIARKKGLVNAVDFEFRMEPGLISLKREIEHGSIGTIKRVNVCWLSSGGTNLDGLWSWKHDAALAGGALENFGCHVIDYLQWLCNRDIVEVFARPEFIISSRKTAKGEWKKVTAEDGCDMICHLNGIIANLNFSNCYPCAQGHRIEVYGDSGRLLYHHKPPFTPDKASLVLVTNSGYCQIALKTDLPKGISDTRILPFRTLATRFVEAVFDQTEDIPDFSWGVRMRRVLDTAHESMKKQRFLRVPNEM